MAESINQGFETITPFTKATACVDMCTNINSLSFTFTIIKFLSKPFKETCRISWIFNQVPILIVANLGIICNNLKVQSERFNGVITFLSQKISSSTTNPALPNICKIPSKFNLSFSFVIKNIHWECLMVSPDWNYLNLKEFNFLF